ncbi:MAG: PEP-CTERM sorting domain-containing protein [Pontixanthobacter sp.]
MRTRFTAIILMMISTPAAAWSGAQIPEPSNIALFGLGLTGLLIGRQVAKRKRK